MGTRLCSLADLAATGAKGVTLGVWPQARDIVVVRDGNAVRAYANRCPHLLTTL
jgi:nitrite reductase/ring-hydroxylating ferredoxin subunit